LEKPLLICLTATRNYGWVTRAFLKSNSLWADLIIIADQHSTDGTREIVSEQFKNNVLILQNKFINFYQ
jgi:GT2 family glycosyltransferase